MAVLVQYVHFTWLQNVGLIFTQKISLKPTIWSTVFLNRSRIRVWKPLQELSPYLTYLLHISQQFLDNFFTASLVLFDFNFQIPKLWAYLVGNIVTQYICIRSVYVLTSECSSLTVTLVVTLRKFMSLMFSIFYFQNPFTLYHWFGTVLVFGGTLIFVELASKISEALLPKKETKIEWCSASLRLTPQQDSEDATK